MQNYKFQLKIMGGIVKSEEINQVRNAIINMKKNVNNIWFQLILSGSCKNGSVWDVRVKVTNELGNTVYIALIDAKYIIGLQLLNIIEITVPTKINKYIEGDYPSIQTTIL